MIAANVPERPLAALHASTYILCLVSTRTAPTGELTNDGRGDWYNCAASCLAMATCLALPRQVYDVGRHAQLVGEAGYDKGRYLVASHSLQAGDIVLASLPACFLPLQHLKVRVAHLTGGEPAD